MADEVIFRIVQGSLAGEEFVFDEKGLCLIGRSADCALQIPKEKDMRISRRHCLLILEPPNVRIRDLGSRNGTMVNGELLDSGSISDDPEQMTPVDRILKDGDVVSIGETILNIEIPSEKPAGGITQTKPRTTPAPQATKVIKLTKPVPTQTGSVIPKSQAVSTGFFAPPTSNTASRTIAMTEAIPREDMKNKEVPTKPSMNASKQSGIMQAKIISQGPGSVNPGPLAPPPKTKNDGGMTMIAPAAGAGPLAPPPPEKTSVVLGKKVEQSAEQAPIQEAPAEQAPPEPERPVTRVVAPTTGPKGTRLLVGKKKATPGLPPGAKATPAEQAPAEGQPRILKAKIVSPGSTAAGRSPKKLQGHMKTVVMDTREFEEMPPDMIEPPDEDAVAEKKPKKRVTKFKVKGPS